MTAKNVLKRIGIERREFLRYTGTSVLGGAAGLMASRWAHSSPALGKVDRRKLLEYPTLSLKERDWRWDNARKLMRDHKVDALFVPTRGGGGNPPPANYFSNDPRTSAVLFPADGEPTAFMPADGIGVDMFMRSELDGQVSWIRDWRLGAAAGPDLVEFFKAKQLASSRIGTIGLFQGGKGSGGQPLGPYLKNALPQATFVELFDEFVLIWMVNSEEGLAMFRKAALGVEAATEAFIEAAKPQANLADISTAILNALVPYGLGVLTNFPFELHTGPEGGLGSKWLGRGLPPPVIKKGHIVQVFGLSCFCGHMEAQVQIAVSIGEPSKEMAQLGRLAREGYEIGVKKIRPGATFGEVSEAMLQPNRREGAMNITPSIHSVNGNEPVSVRREGMWENYTGLKERFAQSKKIPIAPVVRGDIVLQEGMTFVLESNSAFGRKYIDVGGSVICTKDGCEELNDLATRLVVVDA